MSDKSWEPGMYECFNVLNNFCFHVYAQNLLSHFLTLTLSHSHSFSLSHSFNLSFNHSRHAEQVLFSCQTLGSKVTVYSRKLQCFFLDLLLTTLSSDIRVHRAGSQLKRKFKNDRGCLQQALYDGIQYGICSGLGKAITPSFLLTDHPTSHSSN